MAMQYSESPSESLIASKGVMFSGLPVRHVRLLSGQIFLSHEWFE